MAMHNPPHPGAMLHDMLPDLNVKIAKMARHLHFSREMLSRVINDAGCALILLHDDR